MRRLLPAVVALRDPTPSLRGRAVRWIAVALWAAGIFVLSSRPGSQLPGGFSVQAHLVEFAILGALIYRALLPADNATRAAITAVAAASAYGVTDELHQLFVPQRMADPKDWAVDTVGAFLAVAILHTLRRSPATDETAEDQ